MSGEDDTYSTIFTALKHPLRRRILRRLQASPATYTDLLNELSIENGLLNYHLESVRELLTKREDGRYTLNEFGRAGVQLLKRVEEPITNDVPSNSRRDLLVKVLSVAIIIALSFSTWSLYSSNQALNNELKTATSLISNSTHISTSNNSPSGGFPEHIPQIPLEETYGLKANLTSTAAQWSMDRGAPLLQPTWLPNGMKQTAVYVLKEGAVSTQKGIITMVTTLYSFSGRDDPGSAEVLLGVQMIWNSPWMVPSPGVKIGEGNYTVINGNPGYVGVIGWYYGSYPDLYGYNGAKVVIVRYGDVLYYLRAPTSFSSSDLMRMANSLKPV
ncbi:MAG: hypothetical protein ABSA11_09710 [Candidatus Bathyarchaeia archaeon]|jgi:DNA-binding transcriptional ArsR family regulator